jgi:hypothetical protein
MKNLRRKRHSESENPNQAPRSGYSFFENVGSGPATIGYPVYGTGIVFSCITGIVSDFQTSFYIIDFF